MLKAGTAARRQSLRGSEPVDSASVRAGVEHFLQQLDLRLQQHDPNWVGHCKLLVMNGEQTAYASVTAAGDAPRWAGTPQALTEAEITIYMAIYSASDAEVAGALDETLARQPIIDKLSPLGAERPA